MPIAKEPKPLPSELEYAPAGSSPYRVATGDSWYSLAERSDVKASGMTASDLCYFNFKTRVPSEINWYLYNKVGCRISTRDGKNYMFSAADQPGIIYLPKAGPPSPVNEILPKTYRAQTHSWLGLGVAAGTQFAVLGIETMAGFVASLDEPGKGMAISASTNRAGIGWGASYGVCGIYVTGVSTPQQLNGHQQLPETPDFNLALGANWGNIAKMGKTEKLKPLADIIKEIGATTPEKLREMLRANPDRWVELIKSVQGFKDSLQINLEGDPNVFIFGIPGFSKIPVVSGGGMEISLFWGLSNFNAVWDFGE